MLKEDFELELQLHGATDHPELELRLSEAMGHSLLEAWLDFMDRCPMRVSVLSLQGQVLAYGNLALNNLLFYRPTEDTWLESLALHSPVTQLHVCTLKITISNRRISRLPAASGREKEHLKIKQALKLEEVRGGEERRMLDRIRSYKLRHGEEAEDLLTEGDLKGVQDYRAAQRPLLVKTILGKARADHRPLTLFTHAASFQLLTFHNPYKYPCSFHLVLKQSPHVALSLLPQE